MSVMAVASVALKNRGPGESARSVGEIHHACSPPRMTSPAEKNSDEHAVPEAKLDLVLARDRVKREEGEEEESEGGRGVARGYAGREE